MASGRRGSWTKHYEDFDVALERDRMLPNPSSPMHHQQQQPTVALVGQQSFTNLSSSAAAAAAAAGGGTQALPHLQQQHQQPTHHRSSFHYDHQQQQQQVPPQQHHHHQAHDANQQGGSLSRSPRSQSFKSFPSSPLNPAYPPHLPPPAHQHQQQQQSLPRSPSAPATMALLPNSTGMSNATTGTATSTGATSTTPLVPPTANFGGGGGGPPTPTGGSPPLQSPFGRPGSRGSINFSRLPSDIGGPYPAIPGLHTSGSRGSMILYRRADSGAFTGRDSFSPHTAGTATPPLLQATHTGGTDDSQLLPPPPIPAFNRASVYSTSGDSIISSDSKYPSSGIAGMYGHGGGYGIERGMVAYAYDPDDEESEDEEDDWLHDPDIEYPGSSSTPARKPSTTASTSASHASSTARGKQPQRRVGKPPVGPNGKPMKVYQPGLISWRGLINISTLIAMIAALLCLFVVYPMVRYYADRTVNARITGNLRINATGQAVFDDEFDGTSGGSPGQGGTGTPTGPRISSTVTQINQGGVIEERGLLGWMVRRVVGSNAGEGVVVKRDVDEWVAEYPSTSYDLPSSSSPGSPSNKWDSPPLWRYENVNPKLPPLHRVVQVVPPVPSNPSSSSSSKFRGQQRKPKVAGDVATAVMTNKRAGKVCIPTSEPAVVDVEFRLVEDGQGQGEEVGKMGKAMYSNGAWSVYPIRPDEEPVVIAVAFNPYLVEHGEDDESDWDFVDDFDDLDLDDGESDESLTHPKEKEPKEKDPKKPKIPKDDKKKQKHDEKERKKKEKEEERERKRKEKEERKEQKRKEKEEKKRQKEEERERKRKEKKEKKGGDEKQPKQPKGKLVKFSSPSGQTVEITNTRYQVRMSPQSPMWHEIETDLVEPWCLGVQDDVEVLDVGFWLARW